VSGPAGGYAPRPLPGAHLSGLSAIVLWNLIERDGAGAQLAAGLPREDQRTEVQMTYRTVRDAAELARRHLMPATTPATAGGSTSAGDGRPGAESISRVGSGKGPGPVAAQGLAPPDRAGVTTAQAAQLLGVSERRVRQLAPAWATQGLARRVGLAWLIDTTALQIHQTTGKAPAA
jgi:hypothetical protein